MIPSRSKSMSSASHGSGNHMRGSNVDGNPAPTSLRALAAMKQGTTPRRWKPVQSMSKQDGSQSSSSSGKDRRDDIETPLQQQDDPPNPSSTKGMNGREDRDDATRTTHASSLSSASGFSHIMDTIFSEELSPSNYNPTIETQLYNQKKFPFDEFSHKPDKSTTRRSVRIDERDELDFTEPTTCRALLPSRSEIKEVMAIGVCRIDDLGCGKGPSDEERIRRSALASYSMESNSLAWSSSGESADIMGLNSVNSSLSIPFDEPYDNRELISVAQEATAVFVEQRQTVDRKGKDKPSYEVIPYSETGVGTSSMDVELGQQSCKSINSMEKIDEGIEEVYNPKVFKLPGSKPKIRETREVSSTDIDDACTIPEVDLPSEREIYSSVDAVVRKNKMHSNNSKLTNNGGVLGNNTTLNVSNTSNPYSSAAASDSFQHTAGKRIYSFYTPSYVEETNSSIDENARKEKKDSSNQIIKSEDNKDENQQESLLPENRDQDDLKLSKSEGEESNASVDTMIRQWISNSTGVNKEAVNDGNLKVFVPQVENIRKPPVTNQPMVDNPADEYEDPDIGKIIPSCISGKPSSDEQVEEPPCLIDAVKEQFVTMKQVESPANSSQSSLEAPTREVVAPSDNSFVSSLDDDESFRRVNRLSSHTGPKLSTPTHQMPSKASGKDDNKYNTKEDINIPVKTRWSFYDSSLLSNEEDSKEHRSDLKERKVWSFYVPETFPEPEDTANNFSHPDNRNNRIAPNQQILGPNRKGDQNQRSAEINKIFVGATCQGVLAANIASTKISKFKTSDTNAVQNTDAPSLDEANSIGSKISSMAPSLDEGNSAMKRINGPINPDKQENPSSEVSLQVHTSLGNISIQNGVTSSNGTRTLSTNRLTPRRRNGVRRSAGAVEPKVIVEDKCTTRDESVRAVREMGDVTQAPSIDEACHDSNSTEFEEMPPRLVISKKEQKVDPITCKIESDERSTSVRTATASYKSDFTYSHLLSSSFDEGTKTEENNGPTETAVASSSHNLKKNKGSSLDAGESSDFTYSHLMSFCSSESISEQQKNEIHFEELFEPLSLDKLETVVEELTKPSPKRISNVRGESSKSKTSETLEKKTPPPQCVEKESKKASVVLPLTHAKSGIEKTSPIKAKKAFVDQDKHHSLRNAVDSAKKVTSKSAAKRHSLKNAVDAAKKVTSKSALKSKKFAPANLRNEFHDNDGQPQEKKASSLRTAVEEAMKGVTKAIQSDSSSDEDGGSISQDSSMNSECEFPKKPTGDTLTGTPSKNGETPRDANDATSRVEVKKLKTSVPDDPPNKNEGTLLKTGGKSSGEISSVKGSLSSGSDNSSNGTVPDDAIANIVNQIDIFAKEQEKQNISSAGSRGVVAKANPYETTVPPSKIQNSAPSEPSSINLKAVQEAIKEIDDFEAADLREANSDDSSCRETSKLDRYTSTDECEPSRDKYASVAKRDTDKYSVESKTVQVTTTSGRYTPNLHPIHSPPNRQESMDGSYLVHISADDESSSAPSSKNPSLLSSTHLAENNSSTTGSGSHSKQSKTTVFSRMMSVTRSLGYYRPPSYEGYASVPSRLTSEQSTDFSSSTSSSDDDYDSKSSATTSTFGSKPREIITRPDPPESVARAAGRRQRRGRNHRRDHNHEKKIPEEDFIELSRSESSTVNEDDPTITGASLGMHSVGSLVYAVHNTKSPTNNRSTSSHRDHEDDDTSFMIDRYDNAIDRPSANDKKRWILLQCGAGGTNSSIVSSKHQQQQQQRGENSNNNNKALSSSTTAVLADIFCNPKCGISQSGYLLDDDSIAFLEEEQHHNRRYLEVGLYGDDHSTIMEEL